MTGTWQRHRWSALLVALLLLLFGAGLVRPVVFSALGVTPLKPPYSDLIAILAAGEAHVAGRDPYVHNPLDPFNRPHVYGPWWLVTGDLGLVRADAWWLGSLLAVAAAMAGAWLLSPRGPRTMMMAVPLLLSPPLLLAMERGNNDLVVLLLLLSSAWLVTRRHVSVALVGGGLLVTAVALKLYPLAAVCTMATRKTDARRAAGWVVATWAACGAVVLSSWEIYRQVATMAPEPLTIFGYGAKLTYYVFLTVLDDRGWLLLGALPVVGWSIWAGWRCRRELWRFVPSMGFESACYLAGALSWSLCYASTINFPYRMVLLLLPARLWLSSARNPAARWQLAGAILLCWTPFLKESLLVLNADESQFTGPPLAWIALGVEHATGLMLTVIMVVSLSGWGWRRFIVCEVS